MPVVTTKNPTVAQQNTTTMQGAQTASQAGAAQTATGSTIPYEQNGQLTPIIKPPKVTSTAQGNEAVMQTAQQQALDAQNKPNETMGLVQSSVQGLLKNPLGYDAKQYQQNQLEQYDRNRASAMLGYQQSTADTSNTGINREKAYQYAMQGAQGRSDLENKVAQEQADKQRDSMLQALTAGQGVAQTQSGLDDSAFNKLLNTRAQYEGERAQTTGIAADTAKLDQIYGQDVQKMAIANGYDMATLDKTYGQDMAKLVANQDWQGGQAQLDREKEIAMQGTDINAKNAIQDKQNAFDLAKLNATQDWQGTQNKIAQDFELALQNDNQEAALTQLQKQIDLDKWKQENGQTFTAGQNAINNALEITLKDKDIASAKSLVELKGKLDSDQLVSQQSFNAVQSDLDRKQQIAVQNGDIQGQKEIAAMKGQIDAVAQEAQNKWNTAEREATQTWTTGENISKQEADKQMQYFDAATKQAMQNNDLDTQKYLEKQKANLLLQLQTQDMEQEQKMAYINAQIAEAKASGDTDRQKQIIEFSTIQDLNKLATQQSYEVANAEYQNKLAIALQNNDAENVMALTKAKQSFDASEAEKDRVLSAQKIALEGKQIEYQGQQMTFDMIEAAVEAGQIAPDAAAAAVNNATKQYGITIEKPDPDAAAKKLEADYQLQLKQFGLTHPEYVTTDNKGNTTVKDEGVKAYNDFVNKTVFGTSDANDALGKIQSGEVNISTLRGKADTQAFKDVAALAPDFGKTSDANGKKFINVPPSGSLIKIHGVLFQVGGYGTQRVAGEDGVDFINITDVNTGKTFQYNARSVVG